MGAKLKLDIEKDGDLEKVSTGSASSSSEDVSELKVGSKFSG